jgi:hypothetical protein
VTSLTYLRLSCRHANVAELADAQDLGSCPARGPGSTPGVRTSSFLCLPDRDLEPVRVLGGKAVAVPTFPRSFDDCPTKCL